MPETFTVMDLLLILTFIGVALLCLWAFVVHGHH